MQDDSLNSVEIRKVIGYFGKGDRQVTKCALLRNRKRAGKLCERMFLLARVLDAVLEIIIVYYTRNPFYTSVHTWTRALGQP